MVRRREEVPWLMVLLSFLVRRYRDGIRLLVVGYSWFYRVRNWFMSKDVHELFFHAVASWVVACRLIVVFR